MNKHLFWKFTFLNDDAKHDGDGDGDVKDEDDEEDDEWGGRWWWNNADVMMRWWDGGRMVCWNYARHDVDDKDDET